MPNRSLPDNWLNCPQFGETIEGVVPIKVPLDPQYRYAREKRWSWEEALAKYPQIGLVVDLTNTDRYYDKQQLYDQDIEYIKAKMPGHGQIPSRREIFTLAGKINGFIEEHPDKIVAVHCTHGFNRTGFLVCAYLHLHKEYTIPRAVESFAKVRQGGIYRTEIIQALHDFYHDEKKRRKIPRGPKKASQKKKKEEPEREVTVIVDKPQKKERKVSVEKARSESRRGSGSKGSRGSKPHFASASCNPLDAIDSRDTETPVWIIPSRRSKGPKN
ncbi:Oidioi.mRNA.OKI2018_I69.XSR.g13498.t1.cds [Oikopleura dioica]|uniref:Oidioi.mRNA.OKI2018_I69.XSR.g13498.t1.cds n=1 Tax=Oikopleura dioica TaxID=34765 RepID=A0ABN7SDZ4_OIKDI|nr:Oidioi.mRNA.OKI2018_I69.XSR.g13498.t1.cds [Oikopleura dioica]